MKFKNLFKLQIDERRVFGLDLLRFFAIFFVVIGHGFIYLPEDTAIFLSKFLIDGVDIFFVLSGFLIGGILIKSAQQKFELINLFNFYKRRWWRTLPNYFLILLILIILNLIFTKDFKVTNFLSYFTFTQNLKTPQPYFFPESWSLSIEEWFYLISAFSIFILCNFTKLSTRSVVLLTILFMILFPIIFRLYRLEYNLRPSNVVQWDLYFRKQVITRLDGIGFGVLGAFIKYYFNNLWNRSKMSMFISGILIIIIYRISYEFIYGFPGSIYFSVLSFSFIAVGTLLTIPLLDSIKSCSYSKLSNFITKVSLVSYSMYLINLTIVQNWIIKSLEIKHEYDYLVFPLYLVIVYFLSVILYKYFEVPTTKLREYTNKTKGV